MPMLNRPVCLIVAALLAGCATTAPPQHESEAAPGANLAAYSTFGWSHPADEATAEEPLRILDVNIREAIRAEMTGRGYTEDADNPGLLVHYETAAADKVRSSPVRFGIGMGSFGGNVGGSVNMGTPSVQSYQEGRLVIHVIDAAGKKEVWYGTISGPVDRKKLDAVSVAKVVALAMQDFPARGASPPSP